MSLSRFLLPLGALILSTGAWKLDPKSCGVDGDALADHLKSSVNDAFDLVSGALTELQKPERSTDVNRLLELLFCPEGTAGRDYNVNHLTETFEGILAMSTEVTEANYHNKDDFVLFCNGDRIKDKQEKPKEKPEDESMDGSEDESMVGYEDTYSGIFLKEEPCTKAGARDLTLAETYQMDDKDGEPQFGNPCDQLQICPWFLEYYKAETYQTWNNIKDKKALNAKWAVPKMSGTDANKNKWWAPLTPIDGTALMTKVIIHEMTHMRLGGPTWPPHRRIGRTVDVRMQEGKGLPIPGMKDVAYGWMAAKRLAKADKGWVTENTMNADMVRYPHQNADSIALFATATRLLRDDFKTKVKDDGTFEKLEAPARRYRSVPEVIEGFVKRSRDEQQQTDNGAVAM